MKYMINKARSFKDRASQLFIACALAMVVPGLAMAQEASFDPSTITAKITEYAGYALVILLALAAAVWGLRAAGLIGGRR